MINVKKQKDAENKNCYCAFCKTPRKLNFTKHIKIENILMLGVFSFSLMFLFWGDFNAKALVIFALLAGVTELLIQFRWRMSLVCRHCGFDPVLYVKKPDEAAKRVNQYIERLKASQVGFLHIPKGLQNGKTSVQISELDKETIIKKELEH